jgi:hypothetical protein
MVKFPTNHPATSEFGFNAWMREFPLAPLAAGNMDKSSIPKVFEEITDCARHEIKLLQAI